MQELPLYVSMPAYFFIYIVLAVCFFPSSILTAAAGFIFSVRREGGKAVWTPQGGAAVCCVVTVGGFSWHLETRSPPFFSLGSREQAIAFETKERERERARCVPVINALIIFFPGGFIRAILSLFCLFFLNLKQ